MTTWGMRVLALGAWLLLAWIVLRQVALRLSAPVEDLQEKAATISRHHGLADPVPSHTDDLHHWSRSIAKLLDHQEERLHALAQEQAKYHAVLASMEEGIIACDAQGRVLTINARAQAVLGLDPHLDLRSLERRPLVELVRHPAINELIEAFHAGQVTPTDRQAIHIHGPQPAILEVRVAPLPVHEQAHGLILVFRDITELRRLEHIRSEFIANISHELRTPLTAITGYLDTLLHEAPSDPALFQKFLEVAHVHAQRLNRLVSDLHRLADIESGRVQLHRRPVRLREVVQEAAAMFEQEVKKKDLLLDIRIDGEPMAMADRDRVAQILINLLDNAVKFTLAGGTVQVSASSHPDHTVCLHVTDTGPGIPAQDLPRLTERFYRVDKARSREIGGTGLGLAIVKHLVQLHNGTLQIDSQVGKGTTVTVCLPAAHPTSVSTIPDSE